MERGKNFAVVNGLAIGEESKGNTVQALVRELSAHTVWRSGGWQGGHHIIHDDGREMALSHFGAGIFEGADTYLKHMVISPVELFEESEILRELGIDKPLNHIYIDETCLVTTPFHRSISRFREILRGDNKKGTIGTGVGEAVRDSSDPELAIRACELGDKILILRKAENIRLSKLKIAQDLLENYKGTPPPEVYEEMSFLKDSSLTELVAESFEMFSGIARIVGSDHLQKLLKRGGSVVNEVSHGTLHHPRHGFLPHITQIDPTSADVLKTIKAANYDGNIIRLGVVRSYITRHGAGPLVSFEPSLANIFDEKHNTGAEEWLGPFRAGYFDIVALKYAVEIGGGKSAYNGLYLSFMDLVEKSSEWGVVEAYEYKGKPTNLSEFFDISNGQIRGIKFEHDNGETHTKRQMELTKLLNECRPILTKLKAGGGQSLDKVFLNYVTQKLGIPVVGIARGPKVTQKEFFPAWKNVVK